MKEISSFRYAAGLSIALIICGFKGASPAELRAGPCHRSPGDTLIYLFPGQGSDHRLFNHLEVPEGYDTVRLSYPVPGKGERLPEYSLRFLSQIDTSRPFFLLGVSLGGMICTELNDLTDPERTILVSSAKTTSELPGRYTFQKKFPLNRLVPKRVTKAGARILQGVVEPDRRHEKETFKSMLKAKDPLYLKRTVDMIIRWERESYGPGIVHIHGDKDHTIPVRNVKVDYLVPGGSHMMMLTRPEEISRLIHQILKKPETAHEDH